MASAISTADSRFLLLSNPFDPRWTFLQWISPRSQSNSPNASSVFPTALSSPSIPRKCRPRSSQAPPRKLQRRELPRRIRRRARPPLVHFVLESPLRCQVALSAVSTGALCHHGFIVAARMDATRFSAASASAARPISRRALASLCSVLVSAGLSFPYCFSRIFSRCW
jgi:hypothetical protein